jgi:hypothetical protein
MKPSPASSAPAAATSSVLPVDIDLARLRNPAAAEFAKGVEVTEVMESMPGELLELFNLPTLSGKL